MCIFTHVSHMLKICSTYVVSNMCLTHVDIFPVYRCYMLKLVKFGQNFLQKKIIMHSKLLAIGHQGGPLKIETESCKHGFFMD